MKAQLFEALPSTTNARNSDADAVENHLEERDNESGKHPDIVQSITTWLKEHPTDQKRIVIRKSNRQ